MRRANLRTEILSASRSVSLTRSKSFIIRWDNLEPYTLATGRMILKFTGCIPIQSSFITIFTIVSSSSLNHWLERQEMKFPSSLLRRRTTFLFAIRFPWTHIAAHASLDGDKISSAPPPHPDNSSIHKSAPVCWFTLFSSATIAKSVCRRILRVGLARISCDLLWNVGDVDSGSCQHPGRIVLTAWAISGSHADFHQENMRESESRCVLTRWKVNFSTIWLPRYYRWLSKLEKSGGGHA